ncbi:hypothetical protein DFH06DRAFT_134259 [Mycena polygramma]|nr:hypothetical protein DFH06DRAFT_134259 [Mycena polygramma]
MPVSIYTEFEPPEQYPGPPLPLDGPILLAVVPLPTVSVPSPSPTVCAPSVCAPSPAVCAPSVSAPVAVSAALGIADISPLAVRPKPSVIRSWRPSVITATITVLRSVRSLARQSSYISLGPFCGACFCFACLSRRSSCTSIYVSLRRCVPVPLRS